LEDYPRSARNGTDTSEIQYILFLIRKYKLVPEKDLGITDLLQCLVDRASPYGGLTKLSILELKEMMGNLYLLEPPTENDSRQERKEN